MIRSLSNASDSSGRVTAVADRSLTLFFALVQVGRRGRSKSSTGALWWVWQGAGRHAAKDIEGL